MPIYNRAGFLTTSITSVLNQTFTDFELLCVDDGSTDTSVDVIKDFANKDNRVHLVELKQNEGRCVARNTGIELAKADWICFLDSDDVFYPNHLETHHSLIQQYPKYNIFATEQIISGKTKKYGNPKLRKSILEINLKDIILTSSLQINQLCFNKTKVDTRFTNENVPVSEDWLFTRQLLLKTPMLKVNTVTNELLDHPNRTMRLISAEDFVLWKEMTVMTFLNSPNLAHSLRRKLKSFIWLLCANTLLSDGKKKLATPFFLEALRIPRTYTHPLFYKALVKYITK
jgi:glycosyltransferase involved in cell wall biosynthesis